MIEVPTDKQEDLFKRMTNAYHILSNEELKMKYDMKMGIRRAETGQREGFSGDQFGQQSSRKYENSRGD